MHHVVNSILAPFGEPIEARPPVPSAEEREAERQVKRDAKQRRRAGGERTVEAGEGEGEVETKEAS